MEILVLASANQRACISIIRTLNEINLNYKIAIQSSKLGKYISFVKFISSSKKDNLVEFQGNSKESFISSLINIKNETNKKLIVLPTGETFLRWCLQEKSILTDNNIFIPTVDYRVYSMVSDKLSFVKLISAYDLPIPAEINSIPLTFERPFVVKPKNLVLEDNHTLKVPFIVENKKNFSELHKMNLDLNKHFIQEYVIGPSVYYCAIYNNGEKLNCFSQQTILQEPDGGSVFAALPTNIPEFVINKVDKIMADLNWFGVMMIEFKVMNNIYYAIECNPRFWGPLQLSKDNGVDFTLELLQLLKIVEKSDKIKQKKVFGYIWFGGVISSFFKKIIRKKRVQYFPPQKDQVKEVKFKDVWFRNDSLLYFFFEIALIILQNIRSLIKCR